jgi:hypothetical protein
MIATLGSLPYDLPPEIIAPVGIPEQAAPRYTFVAVEDAATDATTIEVGEFDIHFSKLKALATNQSLWPENSEPPSDFATTWMHAIIQQLQADNLFPTRVVASAEGGTGICFIVGNNYADIECLNAGTILGVISNKRDRPIVWAIEQNARGLARASERIREFIVASQAHADASQQSTRR